MNRLKIVVTDIAGVGLMLLAIFFGWLPGIGGIPLFLLGLSLLAINHSWAKRLLMYIKTKGMKIVDTMFTDHPILVIAYDIATVILAIGAAWLLLEFSHNTARAAAGLLLLFSGGLFLGNRKRLKRLLQRINRKKT